jgi:glycosyltransferase domain-containing protein
MRWSEFDVQIIVMDGSEVSIKPTISKLFPQFKYIHSPISVEQRLAEAANFISTKYTLMSGDDDLFLFSGVDKCILELENNSELISVMGTAIGFNLKNDKVIFKEAYNELIEFGQILEQNHWSRVNYHFEYYECSTIYSVVRTEVWQKVSKCFEAQPTLSGNLMELIVEYCNVFTGKSKVIDHLFWLRSSENSPQWTSFHTLGFWLLKRKNKDRTRLLNNIDQNILRNNSKLPGIIRKIMFLKKLIEVQLDQFASQFNFRPELKWLILPFLYFFVNLNSKLNLVVKKIRKKYFTSGTLQNNPIPINHESSVHINIDHMSEADELKVFVDFIIKYRGIQVVEN